MAGCLSTDCGRGLVASRVASTDGSCSLLLGQIYWQQIFSWWGAGATGQ